MKKQKINYSNLSKESLLYRFERGYNQEELNKIKDEWVSRNYELQELINARDKYQKENEESMEKIVRPSEFERNRSQNLNYINTVGERKGIRFYTDPNKPDYIYTDDASVDELVDVEGKNISSGRSRYVTTDDFDSAVLNKKGDLILEFQPIPVRFKKKNLLKNVKDSKVKKALTGLVAAGLGASAMFMGLEPAVVVQTVQQAISSMDPSIVVNAIQSAAPSLTAVTAAFAGVLAKFAFHDRKKVDEAKKRLSYFDRGVLVDDIDKYANRNKVPKGGHRL